MSKSLFKKTTIAVAVIGTLATGSAMAWETADATDRYAAYVAKDSNVTVSQDVILANPTDPSVASAVRYYGAFATGDNVTLTINGDVNGSLSKDSNGVRLFATRDKGALVVNGAVGTGTKPLEISGSQTLVGIDSWVGKGVFDNQSITFEKEVNLKLKASENQLNYMMGVQNYYGGTQTFNGKVALEVDNSKAQGQANSNYGRTDGVLVAQANTTFNDDLTLIVKGSQYAESATFGISTEGNPGTNPQTQVALNGTQNTINVSSEKGMVFGLVASGPSVINVGKEEAESSLNVIVKNEAGIARGIYARYTGQIESNAVTTVQVEAKSDAVGVFADPYELPSGTGSNKASGGSIVFNNNLVSSAESTDGKAYGILSSESCPVAAKGNVTLTANGFSDSAGVRAVSSNVTLGGTDKVVTITSTSSNGYAHGIQVRGESTVAVLGKSLNITSKAGKYGYGLTAQGLETNGQPLIAKINVASDETAINASGVGVFSSGDAIVALDSSKSIVVTAPSVIEARNAAHVDVNTKGEADVVLTGDITFGKAYDTDTSAVTSQVNVNLNTAGSLWTGNVKASWIEEANAQESDFNDATLNLSLANGAQWTPTNTAKVEEIGGTDGTSRLSVTSLALNDGIINVNNNVSAEVDTLTGTGTINLVANDVENAGKFTAENAEEATLAVNLTQVTSDELTAAEAEKLLGNITADGASITGTVAEGEVTGTMTLVRNADGTFNVQQALNTTNVEISNLLTNLGTIQARTEMNDLRKRLGDVRAAEGKNGAWVRYDGGKMSGKGLDNDFHKLQIGFDTAVNNAWRLGGALSYTKGDVDGQKTSADTDAYSLAAYGVWSGEKGQFVDVIARVAKLDTELNARSFSGKKLDQTGLSLSGEFGWRFDLSNTVYVEPTVEATYTYINSDEFKGAVAKYDVDSMDSLTTKLGVAAGLKCPNGKGSAYVRAGLVHEFLGDGKLTVTGANRQATFKTDGKDTWVEYAVGGQYHINKNTYVYGDIERTSGAKIDEDWRANVGLRYAF